jgi:hypothetical protein
LKGDGQGASTPGPLLQGCDYALSGAKGIIGLCIIVGYLTDALQKEFYDRRG